MEYHEQETSYKVHTLAVLYLFVEECIRFQEVRQHSRVYSTHIMSRPCDIEHNDLLHVLDRCWISFQLLFEILVINLSLFDL